MAGWMDGWMVGWLDGWLDGLLLDKEPWAIGLDEQ
jgi:hypothetical protein